MTSTVDCSRPVPRESVIIHKLRHYRSPSALQLGVPSHKAPTHQTELGRGCTGVICQSCQGSCSELGLQMRDMVYGRGCAAETTCVRHIPCNNPCADCFKMLCSPSSTTSSTAFFSLFVRSIAIVCGISLVNNSTPARHMQWPFPGPVRRAVCRPDEEETTTTTTLKSECPKMTAFSISAGAEQCTKPRHQTGRFPGMTYTSVTAWPLCQLVFTSPFVAQQ